MAVHSYFTISATENILFKEKASKFIGYAYPVINENDIRGKLEIIKQLHPKATHHCYAYRLGTDKSNYRCNDDGEPAGTAGKPILGQIDSHELTNILLIVVRYYGGTKLGVSGLISAYRECAGMTLENAQKTEKKLLAYYFIFSDYLHLNRVYYYMQKYKANVINQEIANECRFNIGIEQHQISSFEHELKESQILYTFESIR